VLFWLAQVVTVKFLCSAEKMEILLKFRIFSSVFNFFLNSYVYLLVILRFENLYPVVWAKRIIAVFY